MHARACGALDGETRLKEDVEKSEALYIYITRLYTLVYTRKYSTRACRADDFTRVNRFDAITYEIYFAVFYRRRPVP